MRVAPFRFDREFAFPAPREQVWEVLQRTEEYRRWWGWLRQFDVGGDGGLRDGEETLAPGTEARCEIRGPLPYALHFEVVVEDVVPAERVVTRVRGDLLGPARLELADAPEGCTARLAWEVEICNPALRGAALVARPVMEWGHDQVVNRGLHQFRRRAL
ncbi:MAG TPA: SRPBCC family protein [Acidimicrobiia bacterium]|nr:SRPBCC family protein [Acidimicrobiia bacterium]